MAKVIIEISEELKKKFTVECAKSELTQRSVITYLIDKWIRTRKGSKK